MINFIRQLIYIAAGKLELTAFRFIMGPFTTLPPCHKSIIPINLNVTYY